MLTRIQEYTPKPLAVSDPFVKQPAGGEEFSVSLDKATLTLLLDEMSKLGLDTSTLKISNNPAQPGALNGSKPQPAGTGAITPATQRLTPFDPQMRLRNGRLTNAACLNLNSPALRITWSALCSSPTTGPASYKSR